MKIEFNKEKTPNIRIFREKKFIHIILRGKKDSYNLRCFIFRLLNEYMWIF